MYQFTPLEKQSKKAQREYHKAQRNTWGAISPVSRLVPNGKAYNRAKLKQEVRQTY